MSLLHPPSRRKQSTMFLSYVSVCQRDDLGVDHVVILEIFNDAMDENCFGQDEDDALDDDNDDDDDELSFDENGD